MSTMEQNNIENQVCDAISILVDEGVNSAGYDKTISALVVECVDSLKGQYKVKYQDAYYYATSDNIEVEYSKNTQVYILVPGNDFSREKKIIGTVKDLGDTYISSWDEGNQYVVVGRNCAELLKPQELCSYKSGKYKLEELILYKDGESNNKLKLEKDELAKYLVDSKKLRIGATFKTALADEQRQRGNYGISIKAEFNDADNTGQIISQTFNLTVDDMIGMPYDFGVPTAQYLDFDINNGKNFIKITQVALLIADFPVSEKEEGEDYPNDIFISDFIIEGIAPPDAKVFTTYYLDIKSSVGKYLTETDSKTTLEAVLSLKNKTVTSSSLEYYWFIEDASVITTSDLYCVHGGQGWRCLNDQKTITEEVTKPNGEVEKQERKEWVPGAAIREVFRKDIPNIKSIYKCVCIYNSGKSSIAAEIELENTNPTYKFEMSSVNGTEFILDRGKTTLKFLDTTKAEKDQDNSLVYHWAKTDASGGYHYLGGDNSGNGGELPVCDRFDNSSLMKYLRQLSSNYAKYLGNQLVKTKSVYSEYSTFDKENSIEAEKSVLREGFKDFGLSDIDTAKVISDIILVLKLDGPTNEELANAIQPYLDSVSVTWIDEFTFYDVPARSILSYNIFKCTAMKTNGEVLGTARIQLNNRHVANDNGYIIVENGNQTFKYSAEGVAPTDKNNKNPLTIKPLTFKLFDETGNEVSGIKDEDISWYYPLENTLIKVEGSESDSKTTDEKWGIRHGQAFVFDIESRFKYEAPNDVIKIEVKYQDRVLKQDTSFSFIKDGMSGTNGTDYFCRIVPRYDLDNAYPTIVYNKTNGNVFLNRPEYTLTDPNWFSVELWNGSELITTDSDFSVTYSILHPGISMPNDKYSLIIINDSNFSFDTRKDVIDALEAQTNHTNGLLNILRAEISYQGKKYFAELPLAVAIMNTDEKDENGDPVDYGIYIKTGTGYNEVVYAADGARPQYASAYPFEAQVIRYEKNNDVDLTLVETNNNYKTPFTYDYYTLEKEKNFKYNKVDNKFLTISKLTEPKKNENGEEVKNENGVVETVEIEGPARQVVPSPFYNGAATDLGLRCIVKNAEGHKIGTLYFPIHFMLNKFGYSALNDWDGTSIDINNENGYILAPQMGAGKKDTNNRFTGVLMGEMKSGHEADSDIGLLGFHEGVRTIFLDAETGKAEFGAAGSGQIILDPTQIDSKTKRPLAKIYSGNYYNDRGEPNTGEGMLIDLTTPEIRFGSGKFAVTSKGKLIAREADVRGPISSSSVNLYDVGYADFEQIPSIRTVTTKTTTDSEGNNTETKSILNEVYYLSSPLSSGSSADIVEGKTDSGHKCLKITNKESGNTEVYFYIGSKNRNHGRISIKECKDDEVYIISAYVKAETKTANFNIYVVEAKGTNETAETSTVDANSMGSIPIPTNTWTRVSFEYVPSDPSVYRYIGLRFDNDTPGSSIYVDKVQIEKSYSGLKPSDFHPTGTTKIDGGSIYTETITALGRVTAGEFYIGKKDGSNKLFQVNSDGYLYAQGAKFEGHIESGSGKIANWEIDTNALKSQSTVNASGKNYKPWTRIGNTSYENVIVVGAKELNKTEIPKAPFRVTRDGVLHATGVDITGAINATSLTLGNITNTNSNLTEKGFVIQGSAITDGGSAPTENNKATSYFKVSTDGLLQANNAVIKGTIYAQNGYFSGELKAPTGALGGWKLDTYRLYSFTNADGDIKDTKDAATRWVQLASYGVNNAIYVAKRTSTSATWDTQFSVSLAGAMTAKSGTIGGWTIEPTRLSSQNSEDTRFVGLYSHDHEAFTENDVKYKYAIRVLKKDTAGGSYKKMFTVKYNGDVYARSATIDGDSTFAGTLSAVSGTFTSLTAANSKFTGSQIKIDTKGSSNKGAVYIGDPEDSGWKHITIAPTDSGGIGNIGTDSRPFDVVVCYVCKELSDRSLKENIQYYNINQAYEELKNLPIYTFNYLNKDYSKLGTIIDYIPSEVMAENVESNLLSFDLSSLSFWNIAATQVIQQKLEETIQEKEILQNRLDILEQKFLEMEEKLNGFN